MLEILLEFYLNVVGYKAMGGASLLTYFIVQVLSERSGI